MAVLTLATPEITPKSPIEPVDRDRSERRRPRDERRRPPGIRPESDADDPPPRPPQGRIDVLV